MSHLSRRARIAVLASGGGSNLQAILDHFDRLEERRGGDVVLVVCDRPGAGALARAEARRIPAVVHWSPRHPERGGQTLDDLLDPARIDLVVLAGYLKLIPSGVVARFRGRMVNVHPALLPAFGGEGMYGSHVHAAVLASGVALSGPTVHFVDEHFDRGPIIAQWPVPVLRSDSVESLARRVLAAEHMLFPLAVDAVARGSIYLDTSGRVVRPDTLGDRACFALHAEPIDAAEPLAVGATRLLG